MYTKTPKYKIKKKKTLYNQRRSRRMDANDNKRMKIILKFNDSMLKI